MDDPGGVDEEQPIGRDLDNLLEFGPFKQQAVTIEPGDGPDAGPQFRLIEGLGDEVVRANLKAPGARGPIFQGGDHDDGHFSQKRVGP